jgi:hypothetical protein
MASNINPNNIDGTYPVAGQDNDSQGFRDNFTNIKNNFTYSRDEIGDLQSKALLKMALGPGDAAANNDMDGAEIYRPTLKAYNQSFMDLGTVSSIASISFLDGNMQKITGGTISDTLTIGLQDFPASGTYGAMRLWLVTMMPNYKIIIPANTTLGWNRLSNYDNSTKTISFPTLGNYMFEFSTADGGNNFWIIQLA